MQQLYQARDRIEAQLLCDYLKHADVECRVFGDLLAGAAGELPTDIYPSIWVLHDHQWPLAQNFLKEFLDHRRLPSRSDWRCHRCEEFLPASFEFCWQCGGGRESSD